MSNITDRIKKSIIMLFSFAVIASMITVINVTAHDNGSSNIFTKIMSAQAEGAIRIERENNQVVTTTMPRNNCAGGCISNPVSGPVGVSKERTLVYPCTMQPNGRCQSGALNMQETHTYKKVCDQQLRINGVIMAQNNGSYAMNIIRFNYGYGQWNPAGIAEIMISHLAGKNPNDFTAATGWTDIAYWAYSGTTATLDLGMMSWSCVNKIVTDQLINKHEATMNCGIKTDGRPFPYAVGVYVNQVNRNTNVISDGVTALTNKDWIYTSFGCLYVSPSTPPPKVAEGIYTCYYNMKYSGAYSTNLGAIKNGGTATSSVKVLAPFNGKKANVSGSSSQGNLNLDNCTQSYKLDASLPLTQYAYFRLQGNVQYDRFQFYRWNMEYTSYVRKTAEIRYLGSGSETSRAYGTNVCSPGSAGSWKQYPNYESLPVVNFDYSECLRNRANGWTCTTTNPRINGVSNAIEVMRNGNKIPTVLGGATITGSGVRDVGGAPGVVSDGNMSYRIATLAGSSPFNGTDPNASKQYFEMHKADGSKAKWNTWMTNPRANQNSTLSYYWSSDNGKKWGMSYEAKLDNAEFAVPWQEWSDSAPTTRWMPQKNVDCNGVKNSNSVIVLRAVSSDG